MPFTPYHFGPSAFFGLVFRKWIDVPVFLLANIVVDIEVLFFAKGPHHRYFHTLLIGAAAGVVWGLTAYPLRGLFKKIMQIIRIPYQTTLPKMIISGIFGIWLHTIIDAVCTWDVRLLWPSRATPLFWLLTPTQVKICCLLFLIGAVILYLRIATKYTKQTLKKEGQNEKTA